MNRKARALFLVALGVAWIAVSVTLSLSRFVTAAVAMAALILAGVAFLFEEGNGKAGKPGRLGRWWRGLSYRNKVNAVAATCAVVSGLGVAALLLAQPIPDEDSGPPSPETTTTTTHSTESGSSKDGPASKTTDTKVTESKETTEDAKDLLGRSFDNEAGVIIVRLGLALLTAFIVGLATQRIALGKYGVKLPFGLGEFSEISDAEAKSVTDNAKKDPTLAVALETSKREGPEEELERLSDTRIELVTLRGKVESELRAKAQETEGVDAEAPIGQVIDALSEKREIGAPGRAALRGVIDLGNQAAHGAEIDPGVDSWLTDEGRHLPGAIASL